ncbi:hypothetical protein J437_LFUL016943 [Ladona fulva]|uniref:NHR domain-containing protein n=1 Tax=Ladona fulva TaxID=123851 RepID=A0A8K0KMP2_LADFU|nr:hypothetical protein J437_LFUL016943 [Ladona fulva]
MSSTAVWNILLSILLICKGYHAAECEANSRKDRELNININSTRNSTGDWVSSFTARKDTNSDPSDMNMDITWKFSECEEKKTVLVRGLLRESPSRKAERLLFHPNCGTNVAIVNNGRTIVKLNDDEKYHGFAMTNRPLKDNELFEVRLDRKTTKWDYGMAIGVTTHDPNTLVVPIYVDDLKNGTWFFRRTCFHKDGNLINENYMEPLNKQKVGDRLGIKRTEFGTLHVYINGVDKGPAASRVPAVVYGVYEVRNEVVAATIVDPSK